MNKITPLALLSALLVAHSAFAADTFVFDKAHSTIGFQVRHLFSKVPGKFDDFSGQIKLDEANPEQSSVEATIKTPSDDTGVKMRDDDLRSPNFFDPKNCPYIAFNIPSVNQTRDHTPDATGALHMPG